MQTCAGSGLSGARASALHSHVRTKKRGRPKPGAPKPSPQRSAYSPAPGKISGVPGKGVRGPLFFEQRVTRAGAPGRGSPPGRRTSPRRPAPAPAPPGTGRGGVEPARQLVGRSAAAGVAASAAIADQHVPACAVGRVGGRSASVELGLGRPRGPRAQQAVHVDRGVLGRQRGLEGVDSVVMGGPLSGGGSVARCWVVDADIDASSRARAPLSAPTAQLDQLPLEAVSSPGPPRGAAARRGSRRGRGARGRPRGAPRAGGAACSRVATVGRSRSAGRRPGARRRQRRARPARRRPVRRRGRSGSGRRRRGGRRPGRVVIPEVVAVSQPARARRGDPAQGARERRSPA